MGQQQMLLIIVGVIITGIAIAIGVTLFAADSVSSNKDALISDLNLLGSNAYQYKNRLGAMGGGGGRYTGYNIPDKLKTNGDGTFSASVQPQVITFTATSAQGYGTVTAQLDSTGQIINISPSGDFL